MRYLRFGLLGGLGLLLVSVSLANRAPVTLKLLPDDIAVFLGVDFAISLPLFLVVLGGVAGGVIVGFVWEWLREYKHRRDAGTKTREVRKLEREVSRLKGQGNEGKDEVLAILEEAG